jgi:uncharacterized protein (TIRG00374 family)
MPASHSTTRRTLVNVIKIGLGLAILCWLLLQAQDNFSRLSQQSIRWPLLVAALLCTFVASALNFCRWHLLIRALGISARLIDTMRLGALGLALNFVSPGALGGDFFKAAFLAHGQPGKRTEAVATVVADRVMGLLTMLGLASCGILATELLNRGSATLKVLCQSILLAASVAWLGAALLLIFPALTGPWICARLSRIPFAGRTVARLLGTVQSYRTQKKMLLAAFSISLVMALTYITSFYLVARGLPIHEPPWSQHVVMVPVSALVGAIPLTPSGLGTMELAIEELYKTMPGGGEVQTGDGTLVGLGRRATEIAVALIGLVFYLSHRREVEEVYAEAEAAEV